ncbi:hypothetical protein LIS77_23825 [Cytobacillus firmus]|uniref:hypothetical protein n=1 Tax=Cytobacillus firmus TaxID=1399 RepID=UPI001C940807|nr:hypothetical protein [Cytobacillus firmus]MBY6054759.1 hypothetical protein [Cytobacillus firmus]USK38871.1 hypothetical protein LIS77_23825 [Cytobacillus firmus]WHY61697.1 hypothetical protein QNH42_24530 [Cytobacillus firmus]
MKKLSIFLLMLVFTAGCANNKATESEYDHESRDGVSFINNDLDRTEDNDTMDRTMSGDQNPNFINFDGKRLDNQDDIDQARKVIAAHEGFRPGAVWVNGEDMWVTAYRRGNMTHQEKIDSQAQLHKMLIKALPRYHIEVKVQEDRT